MDASVALSTGATEGEGGPFDKQPVQMAPPPHHRARVPHSSPSNSASGASAAAASVAAGVTAGVIASPATAGAAIAPAVAPLSARFAKHAHLRHSSSSASRSARGILSGATISPRLPPLVHAPSPSHAAAATDNQPHGPAAGATPRGAAAADAGAAVRAAGPYESRPSVSSPTRKGGHERDSDSDDGDDEVTVNLVHNMAAHASPSANLTTLNESRAAPGPYTSPLAMLPHSGSATVPGTAMATAELHSTNSDGTASAATSATVLPANDPRLCLDRLLAADALTRGLAAAASAAAADEPVHRVASPVLGHAIRSVAVVQQTDTCTPPSKRRQRQAWNSDSGLNGLNAAAAATAVATAVTAAAAAADPVKQQSMVALSASSSPRGPSRSKWGCLNLRSSRRVSSLKYAKEDEVIRIGSGSGDGDADADADADASSPSDSPVSWLDSYSLCLDRYVKRLPPFLRRTLCGVRVLSWIGLLIMFAAGLVGAAYLWGHFLDLVRSLTQDRFDHNCFAQSESFARELSAVFGKQEQVAMFAAHTHDTRGDEATTDFLTYARDDQKFDAGFSTASYCVRVAAGDKSVFETTRGFPILQWDAATGSVRNASGTGSGPAGDFFPLLVHVADGRGSSGFRVPIGLDLASLPGMTDAFTQLDNEVAVQFSRPYFVGNYSAPTRTDGGDASQPLSTPAWLAVPTAAPASSVPSHHGGYRMLMLTPVHRMKDPTTLSGAMLSSFDLTPLLHLLMHKKHVHRAMPPDLVQRMTEKDLPTWPETATTRIGIRGENESYAAASDLAGPALYYEREASVSDHSPTYIDASDPSSGPLQTAPYVSSWPVLPFLSHRSPALDWSYTCQAHASLRNHFSQLDTLREILGSLVVSFVILVTMLAFVLLRWHNAIFVERVEKSRYISQMNDAIVAAETARDQKTDFMAFLCHELRNPLHAVLSMSDLLRDCQLDPEQTDAVFTIHASSELMLAITNDILDLSKVEAGKIELDLVDIDLYALIHSLVRANNSHAQERGVTVIGRVDPRVPRYIQADPTRINQMLTNLLSNAIKFSRKHGEVRLEVELLPDEEEETNSRAGGSEYGDECDDNVRVGKQTRDTSVFKKDVCDMMLPVVKRPAAPQSPHSVAHPSLLPLSIACANSGNGGSGAGTGMHSPHTIARARLGGVLNGIGRRPSLSVLNDAASRSPVHLTPEHGTAAGQAQPLSRGQSFSIAQSPPPQPPGGIGGGGGDPVSLLHQQHAKHARIASDSVDKRTRRILRPTALSGHLDMSSFFASAPPPSAVPSAVGGAPAGSMLSARDLTSARLRMSGGAYSNGSATPMPTPGPLIRTLQHSRIISSPSLIEQSARVLHPSPAFAPLPNERQLSPLEKRRRIGGPSASPLRICSNGVESVAGEGCQTCDDCIVEPSPKSANSAPTAAATTPAAAVVSTAQVGPVRLAFKVSDDGCGIPSDSIPILFVPYTQAKRSITRSHGGTGLGLAIVKRLCDLMSATITVESELNVGTTFTLASLFTAVPPPSAKIAQLMQELPPPLPTVTRFDNYNTITTMDGTSGDGGGGGGGPAGNTTAAVSAALRDATRAASTGPVTCTSSPFDFACRPSERPFVPALPAVLFPARNGSVDLTTSVPMIHLPSSNDTVASPRLANAGVRQLLHPLDPSQGRMSSDTTRGPSPTPDLSTTPDPAHSPPLDATAHPTGTGTCTNSPALFSSSATTVVDRDISPRFKSRSSISIDTGRRRIATHKVSSRVPIIGLPPAAAVTAGETSGQTGGGSNTSVISPHGRTISLHSSTALQQQPQQSQQAQQHSSAQVPFSGMSATSFAGRGVFASSPPTPTSAGAHSSTSEADSGTPALSPAHQTSVRPPVPIPLAATPLPAAALAVAPPPAASSSASSVSSAPKLHVLVVDDAAINRKIMLKMLGGQWEVDQAENGLEAVNLVDANPDKYCCVLMDLMMPVMSGSEALTTIRAHGHTALPVIAVTANTMNEDVTRCMQLSFNAFISKPCRKQLVCTTVNNFAQAYVKQRADRQQQLQQLQLQQQQSDSGTSVAGSAGSATAQPSSSSSAPGSSLLASHLTSAT